MKTKNTKKNCYVVNHMTAAETREKVNAAKKNGYLDYEKLTNDERQKVIRDLGQMFAVCTQSIVKYVMDCQMGEVDGFFYELNGSKPVLIPPSEIVRIFTATMIAKEMTGFTAKRVA